VTADLRSRALSDRVVLLGLVALSTAGETPAHTGRVACTCGEHTGSVRAEVRGTISEAEAVVEVLVDDDEVGGLAVEVADSP
jgi:hypothetical protein